MHRGAALLLAGSLALATGHGLSACMLDAKGTSGGAGGGAGGGTGGAGGVVATCDDLEKNGAETDVDCGGGECPVCRFGQACAGNADCAVRCEGNVCVAEPWTLWTQRNPATSAGSVVRAAAAYDAMRQQTVRFGGLSPVIGNDVDQTWLWDGTDWTMPTGGPKPSPRQGHAMAWVASRQAVLLCGGTYLDSSWSSDTWEWDGVSWAQLNAGSPGERAYHAIAYDGARDRVVLFGGTAFGIDSGETWELDPAGPTWAKRAPAQSPPARAKHAMVYDEARHVTVLFGGETLGGATRFADTWEWDGTTWTDTTRTPGPEARSEAAMAYDTGRSKAVLFGGFGAAGPIADVWELAGSTWALVDAAGPDAGWQSPMAYDVARKRSVLLLALTDTFVAETWEYYDVGTLCTSSAQCASGSCVDGICCTDLICDVCETCATVEKAGACAPLRGADDIDSCNGAVTCDAAGQCVPKG